MQFTSYRSTYKQQLDFAKGMIKKCSLRIMDAKEAIAQDLASSPPDYAMVNESRRSLASMKENRRHACEHYRNLVAFERECARRKVERKIARERAAMRAWAANGMPALNGRQKND